MTAVMEEEDYWSAAWRRHVDNYLAQAPRLAHWLAGRFPLERNFSFLQIAAGSCRDSLKLIELGYDAVGTDFDDRTLDYLREIRPDAATRLRREDAFHLTLSDKEVDVTFSNGFWVLFDDDDKVVELLREQVRVTRRHALFVLQNGENAKLRAEFARLRKTDDLYDIRFFSRADIARLVAASGVAYKSMKLHRFGGPADALYADRFKGVWNPLVPVAHRFAPRLYDLQPWHRSERIVCVLEL